MCGMTFRWTEHRFAGGALALDVANSVILRSDAARSVDRFAVAGQIATALSAMSRDIAWRQYVKLLVGRARIEGIDLEEGEPERVFSGSAA